MRNAHLKRTSHFITRKTRRDKQGEERGGAVLLKTFRLKF